MKLLRQQMPPLKADFFVNGSALHSRELEDDYTSNVPATAADLKDVEGMQGSLAKSSSWQILKKKAVSFEKQVIGKVFGTLMFGIIDIFNPTYLADIKTTACSSLKDFEKSCLKYGYWRQAFAYMEMTGVKRFFFIVVQKRSPWNVFIIDTDKYPKEMAAAAEEVKFLLELNKLYPNMANK